MYKYKWYNYYSMYYNIIYFIIFIYYPYTHYIIYLCIQINLIKILLISKLTNNNKLKYSSIPRFSPRYRHL